MSCCQMAQRASWNCRIRDLHRRNQGAAAVGDRRMHRPLLAGTARRDITPPPGVSMGGYGNRLHGAQGTHDALSAKALVLRQGDVSAALVSCDLLGLEARLALPMRREISANCGIPVDHVMIVCTHTHSGPDTLELFGESMPEAYLSDLRMAVGEAVAEAMSAVREARTGWGTGDVPGISMNRRTFERGPLDTEVGVLRIEDLTGRPIALVTHFACHPVALGGDNLHFSADFPGFAMALLEQADPGCLALFVNGAFGNVNTGHRADLDSGDRGKRTFAQARALGHALAGEVLKVHNLIRCEEETTLACATAPLTSRSREIPDQDWDALRRNVAWAWELMAQDEVSEDDKLAARSQALYDRELLMLHAAGLTEVHTEVMALRVGSGVLAGAPAETFIEYQMALKNEFAANGTQALLTALCNDWIGYVPTPAAFAEGGYETRLCRWSRLEPGSGDALHRALHAVVTKIVDR